MRLKKNILESNFFLINLPSFLFFISAQILLITVILTTTSLAVTTADSPFGVSGVRYPDGLSKGHHISSVSIQTKDTGASWVRGSTLVWGHLETSKGHYNWSHFDMVIRQCQSDNINLLINVAPFARWDQGDKRGKPNDMKAFLVFLEKLVERYDFDGVNDMPGLQYGMHHFEILNEPMAVGHFFDGDIHDFFDIYKQSYPVIKQASPKAQLLLAGLADIENNAIRGLPPTFSADPLTKQYIKTFHTYYDLLHKMDIERYYDIMNLHIYDSNLTSVVRYYQKFNKPIWITETSESNQNGEIIQSQMLIKRFTKALALGVDKIFWFSLVNDRHMLHSGLFDTDLKPRKTFFAYRLMVDKLKNIKWHNVEIVPTSNSNIHCYAFPKSNNNGIIWVAWADKGKVELNLNIPSTSTTVTPLQFPDAVVNNNTEQYHFKSHSIAVSKGRIRITLDTNPIFIETVNPQPYTITVTSLTNEKFQTKPNRGIRKDNRSSFQFPPRRNDNSPPPLPTKRPIFGKLKAIDGNKLTFFSPRTRDIVVYIDENTMITQNRYNTIDLKQFHVGDDVVIFLRQTNTTTGKQFISNIDKLPVRSR